MTLLEVLKQPTVKLQTTVSEVVVVWTGETEVFRVGKVGKA